MAKTSARPEQSQTDQSAFEAGRKRGAAWFVAKGHSLCVCRDQGRAAYLASITAPDDGYTPVCRAFDDGFASSVADFIAGVNHG